MLKSAEDSTECVDIAIAVESTSAGSESPTFVACTAEWDHAYSAEERRKDWILE